MDCIGHVLVDIVITNNMEIKTIKDLFQNYRIVSTKTHRVEIYYKGYPLQSICNNYS